MTRSIFSRTKDQDLAEYLNLCNTFRPMDFKTAYRTALASIRYYKGDEKMRDMLVAGHTLENRWYASLEAGTPDYSVYDDDFFISDVWACWITYSRKYLLSLIAGGMLTDGGSIQQMIAPHVTSVVDLGCGFGYTTAGLKELFPAASVYGTNIEGTLQFKVGSYVGKGAGFTIVPEIKAIDGGTDLVFASEYFEHIQRPIDHLNEVLVVGRPKYLILANAFGSRSVGHFNEYLVGDGAVSNKLIGRMFNGVLRDAGYSLAKTKLWNNRPSFWVRNDC